MRYIALITPDGISVEEITYDEIARMQDIICDDFGSRSTLIRCRNTITKFISFASVRSKMSESSADTEVSIFWSDCDIDHLRLMAETQPEELRSEISKYSVKLFSNNSVRQSDVNRQLYLPGYDEDYIS